LLPAFGDFAIDDGDSRATLSPSTIAETIFKFIAYPCSKLLTLGWWDRRDETVMPAHIFRRYDARVRYIAPSSANISKVSEAAGFSSALLKKVTSVPDRGGKPSAVPAFYLNNLGHPHFE
jgi:hypothetical protein